MPVSPGRTNGTTTELECLAWGEACLWLLDLEMAHGCGGGNTVQLGLRVKRRWARRLAYPDEERWRIAEEGASTLFLWTQGGLAYTGHGRQDSAMWSGAGSCYSGCSGLMALDGLDWWLG
jgi:hypothetical protein